MNNIEKFKKDLEHIININCIENICDVPDLILAEMIVSFVEGIGPSIKKTLDWHGCDSICHPSNTKDQEKKDD